MFAGPVLTAVSTIALIGLRLAGKSRAAGAAKMTASTGFLWTAYSAGIEDAFGAWVAAGLVLGWFGDLFLIPRGSRRMFLAGIVSFLLGHVAFIVAITLHGFNVGVAAVAVVCLAVVGYLFWRYLGDSVTGVMKIGVVAYIVVITVMLSVGLATTGRGVWEWLVPASVLFYASDLGVALDRFKMRRFPAYVWSLPMYYAGQTLFALSIQFAI